MNLLKNLELKGKALPNEPLYRHTTFKIGGPVDIWAQPSDLDDIKTLLEIAGARKIPVIIIGGGSNLLAPDEGLKAAAVYLGDGFQAGKSLQKFIIDRIEEGFAGLEFMAGIPGTVGGAIKMNAGAGLKGPWISDFIKKVKVCDYSGEVRCIEKKDLGFGYRASGIKDAIILQAEFDLERTKAKEAVKKKYLGFLTEKKRRQELTIPSAGCVFKNPDVGANGRSPLPTAAELIEGCGLKLKKIGGAMVSGKHANFIVNTGKATFKDVIELIELIKDSVSSRYGINLEIEIEILR